MDYKFKDVLFFVGEGENEEFTCKPFILNKKRNKIKFLIDGKIVEVKRGNFAQALEEGSGLSYVDVVNLADFLNYKKLGMGKVTVSDEQVEQMIDVVNTLLNSNGSLGLDEMQLPPMNLSNNKTRDDYKKF